MLIIRPKRFQNVPSGQLRCAMTILRHAGCSFYGKVFSLRFSSLRKPIKTSEYQETEVYQWEQSPACELPTVMARKRLFNLRPKRIFTGYGFALCCLALRKNVDTL